MTGKVYLVGAGPGDPDLITVKGAEILKEADVIVYDALANPKLLDMNPTAELVDVGKRGGNHKKSQSEINSILAEYGKAGKNVVRLKGGDPFMFGRGAEEAETLRKEGIEVHVIPGVTSPVSVPELAGIPITHRDHASNVTFVTGHERSDRSGDRVDWAALAEGHGTIVVLMGMENAENISDGLISGGMDGSTPAGIITDGSTDRQRTEISDLKSLASTIEEKKLESPGIIVIGNVVRERKILGDLR